MIFIWLCYIGLMYERVTVAGPGSYANGGSNHLKDFPCGRGAHHTPGSTSRCQYACCTWTDIRYIVFCFDERALQVLVLQESGEVGDFEALIPADQPCDNCSSPRWVPLPTWLWNLGWSSLLDYQHNPWTAQMRSWWQHPVRSRKCYL